MGLNLILTANTNPVGAVAGGGGTFDYYIGPSGSDSNAGTIGSPWAITALSTKAATIAGKRIGLLDGTYIASNTNYEGVGFNVPSGSSGAPTILESVNPRGAIITGRSGASYPGSQGLIGVISGSYVTIRNLTVTDGVFKGIAVFYSNNVRIEGCHVYDFNLSKDPAYAALYPGDNVEGIRIEGSNDCVVSNCKIHNCYNAGGATNHNGSGTKSYNNNRTIYEYLEIYDCASGLYDKNGNNDTTVRYCYIHDLGTAAGELLCGFDMPTASGTFTIHHNVLVGNGAMATANDFSIGHNLVTYNNTVDLTGNATTVWDHRTDTQNVSFYNNIIRRNGYSAGYGDVYMSGARAATWDYNLWDNSSILIRAGGTTYSTLSSWQSTGSDPHSIQGSPLFVGTGSGASVYQLNPSSPAKSLGRIGGISSGSVIDAGAFDGSVTQIGCDF